MIFRNPKIVAALIFIVFIIFVILNLLISHQRSNPFTPNIPVASSSPGAQNNQPVSFSVVSTDPANGETNVYAGERAISFTADNQVKSASNYSLTISPDLPFYWKDITTYPSNKVSV